MNVLITGLSVNRRSWRKHIISQRLGRTGRAIFNPASSCLTQMRRALFALCWVIETVHKYPESFLENLTDPGDGKELKKLSWHKFYRCRDFLLIS